MPSSSAPATERLQPWTPGRARNPVAISPVHGAINLIPTRHKLPRMVPGAQETDGRPTRTPRRHDLRHAQETINIHARRSLPVSAEGCRLRELHLIPNASCRAIDLAADLAARSRGRSRRESPCVAGRRRARGRPWHRGREVDRVKSALPGVAPRPSSRNCDRFDCGRSMAGRRWEAAAECSGGMQRQNATPECSPECDAGVRRRSATPSATPECIGRIVANSTLPGTPDLRTRRVRSRSARGLVERHSTPVVFAYSSLLI